MASKNSSKSKFLRLCFAIGACSANGNGSKRKVTIDNKKLNKIVNKSDVSKSIIKKGGKLELNYGSMGSVNSNTLNKVSNYLSKKSKIFANPNNQISDNSANILQRSITEFRSKSKSEKSNLISDLKKQQQNRAKYGEEKSDIVKISRILIKRSKKGKI